MSRVDDDHAREYSRDTPSKCEGPVVHATDPSTSPSERLDVENRNTSCQSWATINPPNVLDLDFGLSRGLGS